MDRQVLLSVTVSALLHAGLLLDARPEKAGAVTMASPTTRTVTVCPVSVLDEPPPESGAMGDLAVRLACCPPPSSSRPDFHTEDPGDLCLLGGGVPFVSNCNLISTIPVGSLELPSDVLTGPDVSVANLTGVSAGLDGSPRTRLQTTPSYPYPAKQAGLTGEVLVEFTVDESGGVLSPHVVSSSNPIFNDAAVQGISRWKFEPGKRGGRVVRFKMAVPIVFSLNEQ